jgi:hypothetical protein
MFRRQYESQGVLYEGRRMISIFPRTPIRLPVTLVQGSWQLVTGGCLPVSNGATGELLLDRSSISDAKFLARLEHKSKRKLLSVGKELRVGVLRDKAIARYVAGQT